MDFESGRRPASERGGPLAGIAIFLITMALMLFVAAPVQQALGMAGLVVTEIMLATLAAAAAAFFRFKPRDVFPFSLPSGRQIAGAILLWAGYLGISLSATLAVALYFPQEVFGVSRELGQAFTSINPALMIAVVALAPAVCEELLCRGFIQHTFRRLRSRWVTIALVAALFGLMHMSPYRFVPTAVLGFCIAYLRDKSGALALPMLVHFVNNCFSTLSSYVSDAGGATIESLEADIMPMIPAMIFLYSIGAPLLIHFGCLLFEPQRPLGERAKASASRRVRVAVVIVLTILFAAGFILNAEPLADEALSSAGSLLIIPFM